MKSLKAVDIRETVRLGLCCGCGVCAVACLRGAIQIEANDDLEYRPNVSLEACDQCGRCLMVCSFSSAAVAEKNHNVSRSHGFGLKIDDEFYQGCVQGDGYEYSASGGLLTSLLKALLERGEIDCVVHAESLFANNETPPYFRASLSHAPHELDHKRSSVYAPVEFSAVLQNILANPELTSCCFVGVPCAVMAVARLREIDRTAAAKIKYLFGLVCSHNVSGQFGMKVIDEFGIGNCRAKLSFRDKVGIDDKDDFNICVTPEGQISRRQPRHGTGFTDYWRSYAYAWNSCLYCSDFFSVKADAAFKDAWGLPPRFSPQGETVVIVRDTRLKALVRELRDEGRIDLAELSRSDLVGSQYETLQFKSVLAPLRLRRLFPAEVVGKSSISWLLRWVHHCEFTLLRLTAWWSKRRFHCRRVFLPEPFVCGVNRGLDLLRRMRRIITRVSRSRQLRSDRFTVLYAAGFGYDNLGDEAQLHANLDNWERLQPGCRIVILSPDPDATRAVHGPYESVHAPRRTWWSGFGLDYFGIGERPWYLPIFLFKLGWIFGNAFFYKYTRLTFMAPNSAYLLYLLRSADVLHLGGGGYLTGKTASRLYDNMALIFLAHYFGTDVILSGHNIGVWQNPLQRWFAQQLRKARFIGLRDGEGSVRDLRTVGAYNPDKVKVLFDDALFCPPALPDRWQAILAELGLQGQAYVALHVHYWKVPRHQVNTTLDRLAELLNELHARYRLPYLLVPMVESDHDAMVYLSRRMTVPVHLLKCRNDFRLAIAAFHGARLCITMKHHPIVFAMGGGVPTVSLAFEDYYFHKNYGALALFGQEQFMLRAESLGDGRFKTAVIKAWSDSAVISEQIRTALAGYQTANGEIIRLYLAEQESVVRDIEGGG